MRRGFGLAGLLGVLLIAGISGVIGYNMGLSAGLTSAGAATAVVVAPWGLGFGPFGFLFGILFFFLFVGLIGRLLFGGRRHGWGPKGFPPGGPDGWGEHGGGGGWDGRSMPPFVEPMLDDWHRREHGGGAVAGPPATGGSTGASVQGAGPA